MSILLDMWKTGIEKGKNIFQQHKKRIYTTTTVLIILVLFFTLFPQLWWILLILIGGLSMLPQLFLRSYFAFELCTLVTIIGGMKFGPLAGAIIGAGSIALGLGVAMQYGIGTPLSIVLFALMGFIASFFSLSSLFWVGIISFMIYDAVMTAFYTVVGYPLSGNLSYLVTHFFFNLVIFKLADAFLLRLL